MYCMNCGKEIDENINYCPYCGHKTMYIKEEKAEITKEQLEEAVQNFKKVMKALLILSIKEFPKLPLSW